MTLSYPLKPPSRQATNAVNTNQTTVATPKAKYQDGVQFVFIVGLEGTGHHWMESLVTHSPNQERLQGISPSNSTTALTRSLFHFPQSSGLWNAHCNLERDINITDREGQVVYHLQQLHDMAKAVHTKDSVVRVPLNTFPGIPRRYGMVSYPNLNGPCRSLNYPSLDLLYAACDKAQVDCRHVYLYRDPLEILYSTVIKRPLNPDFQTAIQMYKTLLYVIANELNMFRAQTLACIGFYSSSWEEPTRKLWGWEPKEFRQLIRKLYKPPTPMENQNWLPDGIEPYLTGMEMAHEEALQACQSAPYQLE